LSAWPQGGWNSPGWFSANPSPLILLKSDSSLLPVLALIALHDKQDSRHIELLVEFAELPVQLPADELRQKHEQLNAVISEFSKLSKGYHKGGHENFMPTDTHKGLAGVAPLLDFAHCAMLPSDGSAVSS